MGNNIGGRRKAKVMKINGEIFKLKTPVQAWDVIKDNPGHVLLESEAVKHYGIRAKPLEPQQELKPKKTYFLVELPKFPEEKLPKRSQSGGIHMSAKDRLECLMLSRRTVSDLSITRPSSSLVSNGPGTSTPTGPVRLKMRLPSAQVAKLMGESKDEVEVAEKILNLYKGHAGEINGVEAEAKEGVLVHREMPRRPALGSFGEHNKAHKSTILGMKMIEDYFGYHKGRVYPIQHMRHRPHGVCRKFLLEASEFRSSGRRNLSRNNLLLTLNLFKIWGEANFSSRSGLLFFGILV